MSAKAVVHSIRNFGKQFVCIVAQHTCGIKNNILNSGINQDSELVGVGSGQKFGGSVAAAEAVEDGAAKFGAVNMIVGEAIERGDTNIQKTVSESSLPWRELRAVNNLLLDPWI